MTTFAPTAAVSSNLAIAWRFALRELRGGLRGFNIFVACIALGVAAIAGVGSVSRSMTDSIVHQGQEILGGDLDFAIVYRKVDADQRAFLTGHGSLSQIATLRAMARLPEKDDQALVEIKAVDAAYPLFGQIRLHSGGDLHRQLAKKGEHWGAVADLELLARLEIKTGDLITIGRIQVQIRDVITQEPDKLSGGVGFGPRVMLAGAALQATGLVQPGSLIHWHHRIALADGANTADISNLTELANSQFPQAGWRIRSRSNASPGLSGSIRRFAQFLTLVGLTALIVGGVGVANAVRAFLEGKRDVIATLKCLGATGGFVFRVYLIQIALLAGVGIAIGLVLGALMPFGADAVLTQFLPIETQAGLYPGELILGLAFGLLTALAFAMWPLGRAHDVPPTALFRDTVAANRRFPRLAYTLFTALIVLTLAAAAILLSHDRRIATIYTVAAACSFVLLHLVAELIQWLARRAPRAKSTEVRLAIGNIHRPGALTGSVVLSLGLGLTLLVAIALIDGNLRHQLTSSLPKFAPSFFFLDIQNHEVDAFESLLSKSAPQAELQRVPMLRGRMVKLAGVSVTEIDPPPQARWALRGDRGVTYSHTKPENSVLVEGTWWPRDYQGPPLVSYEAELGAALGLKIGDTLTVNVLGREIEARIANFRRVQWQSLAINFIMVFTPNTFAAAPHTHLATIAWPQPASTQTELQLLKTVTAAFPTVTSIRVKDALNSINAMITQLAWAIRGVSSITLIASILVLAGALAAGHRNRIYDAVILKTLGATRGRLMFAYAVEYALLGLATAIFGIFAGSIAGWYVITFLMRGTFTFLPGVAFGAAFVALILTVGLGLIGTWRILGHKPTEVLRNL